MKYAFIGKSNGLIIVSVKNISGHVSISVQDNGNRMPLDVSFENSKGFGLQLVHGLTQQLQASIRIERGNGTNIIFEFDV